MFTTSCTREKALEIAEYTRRAMNRTTCCKSQYKFKCFSCGEWINRGDKITMCLKSSDGMTLRFRGVDSRSGLTMQETVFYQPLTGTKNWVHVGCYPCAWQHCHEDWWYDTSHRLITIPTEWGSKIKEEFDEDYECTGSCDIDEFLERNKYPEEKWMKDRIIKNVTKFQAIWRRYKHKKVYADLRKSRQELRFKIGDKLECPFDVGTYKESVHKGMVWHITWVPKPPISGWYYLVYFQDGDKRFYTENQLIERTEKAATLIRLSKESAFYKTEIFPHCTYTHRFSKDNHIKKWEQEPYHDY